MNREKASFALEQKGLFFRLDKNFTPTVVFRLPSILPADLKLLRNIKTAIRRGRATAIVANTTLMLWLNSEAIILHGKHSPPLKSVCLSMPAVLVQAMAPTQMFPFSTTKKR